MQSVSSRFWTRVAVFISYDDNDYFGIQSWCPNSSRLYDASLVQNSKSQVVAVYPK